MEKWKSLLKKYVNVIVDDPPSPYPKKKEGILDQITETHIILLKENNEPEALRLTDIRRIEPKKGDLYGKDVSH